MCDRLQQLLTVQTVKQIKKYACGASMKVADSSAPAAGPTATVPMLQGVHSRQVSNHLLMLSAASPSFVVQQGVGPDADVSVAAGG